MSQDAFSFSRRPGSSWCERRAIQRQSIWCAGLSGLARSSNRTHDTDRRNQMNQLLATRCKTGPDTFSCLTARDSSVPMRTSSKVKLAHPAPEDVSDGMSSGGTSRI
jgi:hypothetical protein